MVVHNLHALTLSLALAIPADALAADDATNIAAGKGLAEQWCAQCHLVSEDQAVAPAEGVPTFFAIADDPTINEMTLRVHLVSEHPTMPNIILTRQQTDEIVAYILSLRSE